MNGSHLQNNLSVFLLGAILNVLAAVDFTGLLDYSVKAVAGGMIWLVFKLIGDYLTSKINNSKQDKPP
jgi:hypothetical protein